MFRKTNLLLVAAAATGLVAASQDAVAFGHTGSMTLLANYLPRIDAVADPALKAELGQRVAVLGSLFAICSDRRTHSQALLDRIHEEMIGVATALAVPPARMRQDMAEAFQADAFEMAGNQ